MNDVTPVPHPLRVLGVARILAGAWFVWTGVSSLLQYTFLLPQAARIVGDHGSTDGPLRALLTLCTGAIEVVLGLVLVAVSIKWIRSLTLPRGPAALAPDEVTSILSARRAPAFGDGPTTPFWPLRRWLSDQLADSPWWNRDVMSAGARAFARGWLLFAAIAACCLLVHVLADDDLLGPFPVAFVVVLVFVTAMWAVLGLTLIPSHGPRIESMKIVLSEMDVPSPPLRHGEFIESAPGLLSGESPALGRTLGILGVATQCALLAWWKLSPIGFPLMTTSIIRHAGSIVGGIFFFVLGWRIVLAAATLLCRFRYESTLMVAEPGEPPAILAATVRSESLGIHGPRHVIAAVAGPQVRDAAQAMFLPS